VRRRSDGGVKALIALLVVLIVLAILYGALAWFAGQWNGE
jgi:type II secretory pathway pseudopilin PulG